MESGRGRAILETPSDTLYVLLGKLVDGFSLEEMIPFGPLLRDTLD